MVRIHWDRTSKHLCLNYRNYRLSEYTYWNVAAPPSNILQGFFQQKNIDSAKNVYFTRKIWGSQHVETVKPIEDLLM